jgi:hypothetical protein
MPNVTKKLMTSQSITPSEKTCVHISSLININMNNYIYALNNTNDLGWDLTRFMLKSCISLGNLSLVLLMDVGMIT